MLRRALPSLFCAFALVAPTYSQEIFVPRELKAIPVHPAKTKEVVAQPETKAPAKDTAANTESSKPKVAKTEVAPPKPEKAIAKEKSAPAKDQKTPLVADQTASKKVTDVAKEKEKAPEKKSAKSDDVTTTKAEKPVVAKESKTSKGKEKVAAVKEKADSELPTIKVEKSTTAAKEPSASKAVAKTDVAKPEAKIEKLSAKEEPAHKSVAKTDTVKVETTPAKTEKAVTKDKEKDKPATVAASKSLKDKTPAKEESPKPEVTVAKTEKAAPAKDKEKDKPATVAASKSLKDKTPAKEESPKPEVTVAKTDKPAPAKDKEKPLTTVPKSPAKSEPLVAKVEPAPPREGPLSPVKVLPSRAELVSIPTQKDPPQIMPAVSGTLDTGFTKIADGFDFPVGKPEAEGYYKARGFRPGGHVGEDWDGVRGGDTDLKDPIFSIGDGIVVFARDVHLGWGNVIIVRHAYRENGNVKYIDALYGHLNTMLVSHGQRVSRGQQIATMGTAHGQYDAHLHFEIRKNLEIGMSRSKFQKDFNNYYDPTQFINSHRRLAGGGANYKVAMNTFTHDWMYHFDKNRDFGSRKRSTGESSAALRRALTSTH
jgi:murein DD-endopeptidase MepM/ murein hydrolase activator NlpD